MGPEVLRGTTLASDSHAPPPSKGLNSSGPS
nr:MAG TPA: hypothetical protein [Caudoviricetes sp.]